MTNLSRAELVRPWRAFLELFVVFCVLLFSACATSPSVKDLQKAEVHYKLGYSYLRENELKKAFVEFQSAIKLNPKDKDSLNSLGLILISPEFKEYEDSVSYFKRAISIDPDYSEALNNLGLAYAKMEKWDEAIKCFRDALGNPLYASPESAYSNLGFSLFKKGDYLNAIDTLKKAISRYPNFAQHFYVLGLVYMDLGKSQAAIDEFKKALEVAPQNVEVHWELANAYLRIGDTKKASEHFKIVAENSGDNERGKEALKYIELLK